MKVFDWQSPGEVARGAIVFALLQALILAAFIAGSHGVFGKVGPNTVDYASFYAAGRLANEGAAPKAYDEETLRAAEEAATEKGVNYQYFFNPPTFLLIMSPLARLPYLPSFCLFELVTLGAWLALGARVAGGGAAAILALLAVPSVWWVLGLGQNSFLSAALMAGGLLLLPRWPVLAGLAFGALCYKPHLGLMIPVALVAGREWRALAGAAAAVVAAVAATVALYGVASWRGFFAMARLSVGGAIDSGKVLLAGRVDPTGAAQMVGLAPAGARVLWGVALLITVASVAWLWRRGDKEARGAGLAASVLVAAPFALFYDLIMASLAAAWLVRAGRRHGFLRGEKPAYAVLLLANLLAAHPVVTRLHVPFGAVAGPTLLALSVRRGYIHGHCQKIST